MNKKRKIILKIWVIFIAIILLILLFLLGLRLPKLPKNSLNNEDKLESSKQLQYQYQTQYINDPKKVQDIIKSLIKLNQLKESKQQQKKTQKQEQPQPINNLDFFNSQVQTELYHKLSKELDKIPQMKSTSRLPEINHFSDETKQIQSKYVVPDFKDENQKLKDIAVVTLATGAVVITCSVLTPILSSVGPIGTIASKLVSIA